MSRRYKQVDVFTTTPFMGNPLAVILDAEGLSDHTAADCMARAFDAARTTPCAKARRWDATAA